MEETGELCYQNSYQRLNIYKKGELTSRILNTNNNQLKNPKSFKNRSQEEEEEGIPVHVDIDTLELLLAQITVAQETDCEWNRRLQRRRQRRHLEEHPPAPLNGRSDHLGAVAEIHRFPDGVAPDVRNHACIALGELHLVRFGRSGGRKGPRRGDRDRLRPCQRRGPHTASNVATAAEGGDDAEADSAVGEGPGGADGRRVGGFAGDEEGKLEEGGVGHGGRD